MAIVISIGPWGGIYCTWGFAFRLCLGWVALTILPMDGDRLMELAASAPTEAAEETPAKGTPICETCGGLGQIAHFNSYPLLPEWEWVECPNPECVYGYLPEE